MSGGSHQKQDKTRGNICIQYDSYDPESIVKFKVDEI